MKEPKETPPRPEANQRMAQMEAKESSWEPKTGSTPMINYSSERLLVFIYPAKNLVGYQVNTNKGKIWLRVDQKPPPPPKKKASSLFRYKEILLTKGLWHSRDTFLPWHQWRNKGHSLKETYCRNYEIWCDNWCNCHWKSCNVAKPPDNLHT